MGVIHFGKNSATPPSPGPRFPAPGPRFWPPPPAREKGLTLMSNAFHSLNLMLLSRIRLHAGKNGATPGRNGGG
jgi:hypothetical protein